LVETGGASVIVMESDGRWLTWIQWNSVSQLSLRTAFTLNGLSLPNLNCIVIGVTRIFISGWCMWTNRLMCEAAKLRGTKRKMKILAHKLARK
jgi:hypothetical protein